MSDHLTAWIRLTYVYRYSFEIDETYDNILWDMRLLRDGPAGGNIPNRKEEAGLVVRMDIDIFNRLREQGHD